MAEGLVANLLLGGVAAAYQRRQQKKRQAALRARQRAQLHEQNAIELRPSNTNQPIDLAYGFTAVRGGRVYERVGNSWSGDVGRISSPYFLDSERDGIKTETGERNQILATQDVLTLGDIDAVTFSLVDGDPIDSEKFHDEGDVSNDPNAWGDWYQQDSYGASTPIRQFGLGEFTERIDLSDITTPANYSPGNAGAAQIDNSKAYIFVRRDIARYDFPSDEITLIGDEVLPIGPATAVGAAYDGNRYVYALIQTSTGATGINIVRFDTQTESLNPNGNYYTVTGLTLNIGQGCGGALHNGIMYFCTRTQLLQWTPPNTLTELFTFTEIVNESKLAMRSFQGGLYIFNDRYVYSVDVVNETVAEIKDFGSEIALNNNLLAFEDPTVDDGKPGVVIIVNKKRAYIRIGTDRSSINFTGLTSATWAFFLNLDDPAYFGTPSILYYLRGKKVRTVGDIEGKAVEVDPFADTDLNIALGSGVWRGGASDGTTLWFVDDTSNYARAYTASTRLRDSSKDINLGTGSWQGGASDGTTLWFLNSSTRQATAYTASTRQRDTSKDISSGSTVWLGGVSDGTTLWFIDDNANYARAYVASTQARDSSKDINLGTGNWKGGVSDGTTLWFIEDDDDEALAYTASTRQRDSSKDITDLDTAFIRGGVSDRTILWFVNDNDDEAVAYSSLTRTPSSTAGDFAYSNNPVDVLHDFLKGGEDQHYGPKLINTQIDNVSFNAVHQSAENGFSHGDPFLATAYPQERNAAAGTSHATYADYVLAATSHDANNPIGLTLSDARRFRDNADDILINILIKRHGFNGVLSTSRDYFGTIDSILDSMPGVMMFRSRNGKMKLSHIDPNAPVVPVATIDENHLTGQLSVERAGVDDRVNRLTIKFSDIELDFAAGSIEFPTPGSVLDLQLQAADGVVLRDRDQLIGCNNQLHAKAAAVYEILTSRRDKYRFETTHKMFLLEPGDVIRLKDPRINLDVYARILIAELSPDFTLSFTAIQHAPLDYDMYLTDTEQIPLTAPSP